MRGVQLYGITCPLLTKSDGTKMGKTEQGAVWLVGRADQPVPVLPVLDQRRRRRRRQLPADAHRAAARGDRSARRRPRRRRRRARRARRRLAEELTRLVHGDAGLAAAQRATEIFFGAEIADLDDAQLAEIFADVPSQTVSHGAAHRTTAACRSSTPWSLAGLAKSKGDARRTVEQGGAYVNNRRVAGVDTRLTAGRSGQRNGDGPADRQEKVRPTAVRVGGCGQLATPGSAIYSDMLTPGMADEPSSRQPRSERGAA